MAAAWQEQAVRLVAQSVMTTSRRMARPCEWRVTNGKRDHETEEKHN